MKDLVFEDAGLRLVITDELVEGFDHDFTETVVSVDMYEGDRLIASMELTRAEATRMAEKLLRFARKATA